MVHRGVSKLVPDASCSIKNGVAVHPADGMFSEIDVAGAWVYVLQWLSDRLMGGLAANIGNSARHNPDVQVASLDTDPIHIPATRFPCNGERNPECEGNRTWGWRPTFHRLVESRFSKKTETLRWAGYSRSAATSRLLEAYATSDRSRNNKEARHSTNGQHHSNWGPETRQQQARFVLRQCESFADSRKHGPDLIQSERHGVASWLAMFREA